MGQVTFVVGGIILFPSPACQNSGYYPLQYSGKTLYANSTAFWLLDFSYNMLSICNQLTVPCPQLKCCICFSTQYSTSYVLLAFNKFGSRVQFSAPQLGKELLVSFSRQLDYSSNSLQVCFNLLIQTFSTPKRLLWLHTGSSLANFLEALARSVVFRAYSCQSSCIYG